MGGGVGGHTRDCHTPPTPPTPPPPPRAQPFGAGPRMCLGPLFAQMSVSLMAATLLQRLRFTPLHPSSQLIPAAYDITLNFAPTGGLHMAVEPRAR